jgi:outer membrane biosynthesis protein TonB
MISSDNLPTFTAVSLGAAILALLLAAFALREARVAGVGAAGVMEGASTRLQDVDQKVAGMEARLVALENAPKPAPVEVPAAPVDPAAPVAPPPAP